MKKIMIMFIFIIILACVSISLPNTKISISISNKLSDNNTRIQWFVNQDTDMRFGVSSPPLSREDIEGEIPISGAFVTLLVNDNAIAQAPTDAHGIVKFNFNATGRPINKMKIVKNGYETIIYNLEKPIIGYAIVDARVRMKKILMVKKAPIIPGIPILK